MAAAAGAESNSDEMAVKAASKRYEGLVMVRAKAIKGKGAWYWAHLEPILVNSSDTGLPKAVKLRCSLCDALFSASNPSRTASEHLKRGTCLNFASPISSMPPSSSVAAAATSVSPSSSQPPQNHRKRGCSSGGGSGSFGGIGTTSPPHNVAVPPLATADSSRFTVDLAYPPPLVSVPTTSPSAAAAGGGGVFYSHQQQLVLSGGKDDFSSLAMLEDSVKRLKCPKSSPAPALSKAQVDPALDFLADWAYECCGSVTFSSLDHPKFKAFLNQVGLPPISTLDFAGTRLDSKFEAAKAECDAKIRDATFFQIASDGWKSKATDESSLVRFAVNLPNGTSLFRRAVLTSGYVHSQHAEEILWGIITEICGSNVQQCVGIVSDKFKAKALKNLEIHHPWMVNLCCQYKGFNSLIKDLGKELPLFKNAAMNCLKLAALVNDRHRIRLAFHKLQLQEYGHAACLRAPSHGFDCSDFGQVHALVEDVLASARALQLVLSDESYKALSMEEASAREVEKTMRNPDFWNELEAVHSLVKLIKTMAREIEAERPRIGQCLPLWEELRVRVREWCVKFHILEGPIAAVIEARFEKNYHPAWAAAFVLDPLYLIREASTGKYLPPFKCLSSSQEKDVYNLVTRLVSREEAHIAMVELMKWRTEGLDPVYARAVQLKQRDPNSGRMRVANPQSSRVVWEARLTEFKSLGRVAVRLIFLDATCSCGYRCGWSLGRWASARSHSRAGMERAQKLMFVAAHSKREFPGDGDDKETEAFAFANGGDDDDVLDDVLVDTSSV